MLMESSIVTKHLIPFYLIPDKKETHHYDFPIKISFFFENVNCHEIFISNQILLKLECAIDEHLYFPFVGTKHKGEW